MAKTVGERLRAARKQKSLSIEDVAHATRIHANTLRGLEDDDYSGFASTTYAKSFLNLYSRHLEIEVDDALELFSHDDTAPIVSGANYIRSVADSIKPIQRTNDIRTSGRHYAEPKRKSANREQPAHPIVLGMFLLLVMGVFGLLLYAGNKAETPEEALRNITRIVGGVNSASEGEASRTQNPAVDIDAGPGRRVTPAAPMTRRITPEPAAPTSPAESERSTPIAQADPPKQQKPPKSTPVSATAIKARPIVATPVTLPAEGEAVETPTSDDDDDNSAAEASDDDETETTPPKPSDDDEDQQGNGGDSPAPGTATTAYRTNQ